MRCGNRGRRKSCRALHWRFLTYNYLQLVVPRAAGLSSDLPNLARTAAITFCASTVSDLFANPLRVLKAREGGDNALTMVM